MKLRTNASFRERLASFISGTNYTGDTLHCIGEDYGYPNILEFENFWNMYRRFGIAKNIIEIYPDLGWKDKPIIESSNQLEQDINLLVEKIGLWTRLKGLDTRQRVGRYAGLFMRVRDGKQPSEPLEGILPGINALVDIIPLYESQLEVIDTEDDVMSDNYAQPTMYEFRGSAAGSRNEDNVSTFNIHPSRIVIASEDSDNGGIYGISALESVYNSLMDLRKIIGAGGEGFYRNAAQSIVFDLKDGASASVNEDLLKEFNEETDEFLKNRMRRSMFTPGMEAKALDSSLTNPKDFFTNALNDVAAGSKIPATILIGQQTGRLASDQDSKMLLSLVQSRREHFQTEIIKDVIDWMMLYGILPTEEYTIEWPDALAASEEEKLSNANMMSEINQKAFLSGTATPFQGEEIREVAGFDVENFEDIPSEELEDDLQDNEA
jgi:hypothetical protein